MTDTQNIPPFFPHSLYRNALLIASGLLVGGGLVLFVAFETPSLSETELTVETSPDETIFGRLELEASAVYVEDVVADEVLFAKDPEGQRALASLTKLMAAVVAADALGEDTAVSITDDALAQEGDDGFSVGERWRLHDLLEVVLVASSNDGVRAVADVYNTVYEPHGRYNRFISTMNSHARELGLAQTYFINESGLDINDETLPGSVGSARDVGVVLVHALKQHPLLLAATRAPALMAVSEQGVHDIENTNEAVARIPWLLAGKTGFTDTAGGNLAVVFEAGLGRPIVAVVLGSSKDGRFSDMQKLVDATFRHIALDHTLRN